MVDILKKKIMFELLETVKRLTETNMAAGNLKDPNGNTRISFFFLLFKRIPLNNSNFK
jgi:hypothetical protein